MVADSLWITREDARKNPGCREDLASFASIWVPIT
ncbi:unnamed protein product [Nippostrongylus brasiliensis]|uniref:Neur_chan_LBD domain-containing protein n=1 Tax=Nippostrongylus brasiliensis TaxID=27835 RepID=A0A0N4YRA2_NIPBR|nr:unnamed protein product [Nippostrongylus brasiliensis]